MSLKFTFMIFHRQYTNEFFWYEHCLNLDFQRRKSGNMSLSYTMKTIILVFHTAPWTYWASLTQK